jgi:hypothetical protein
MIFPHVVPGGRDIDVVGTTVVAGGHVSGEPAKFRIALTYSKVNSKVNSTDHKILTVCVIPTTLPTELKLILHHHLQP